MGLHPDQGSLRSAELFHYLQRAEEFGLSVEKFAYDTGAIVKRSRVVSKRLNGGVGYLMKKNKLSVIWGKAFIDAPGKATVMPSKNEAPKGALGAGAYQSKHIIIATGARPRVLPGIEPDENLVWTYFEAMTPDRMPKSLLIIGSGAIGIEFSSFYRTLGAEVIVVEALPQILPIEDAEIAGLAGKSFEKQGIEILTDAKVTKLEKKSDSVTATIEKGGKSQTITAECVLSAVASSAISKISGSKNSASIPKAASLPSTNSTGPMCRASMPSATSPVRRCGRTRPRKRASSASKR